MSFFAWLFARPLAWWHERKMKQHARAELLRTVGVDDVMVEVMDRRYGIHNWRVTDGMLEARVQSMGQGVAWWGLIGRLDTVATRNWIINVWCEMRGMDPPEVSHAKPTLAWHSGDQADQLYDGAYADTQPKEDDHDRPR